MDNGCEYSFFCKCLYSVANVISKKIKYNPLGKIKQYIIMKNAGIPNWVYSKGNLHFKQQKFKEKDCVWFSGQSDLRFIFGIPQIDVVPIARLEPFRTLKFSRLDYFMALKPYSQVGGF